MSEPVSTEEDVETTPFNRFFVFCCLLFAYILLSWGAGSLYNDGHEVLGGLVGVVAVFAGLVGLIVLKWLVAPGRRWRERGLLRAARYLAFVVVIVGVPTLGHYLTH